jgi:hypothetical protein
MKRISIPVIFLLSIMAACKHKEKPVQDPAKAPSFPVISFIRSQVKKVDTSLYSIRMIHILDSTHTDTTFIPREKFREVAHDFLELPELTSKEYAGRFNETRFYDGQMNRVIFTCSPVDPEKETITSQEVLITPNPALGDKVNSIIIEKVVNNKEGFLQVEYLWQVDKSFQITTTTQKPGEAEKTSTLKVIWNENEFE